MVQASPLQKAIYTLLVTEPFYAHFILNSKIYYDKYGVKTAAAAVISGVPTLIFCKAFIEACTPEQLVQLVKHEILHLLFSHTILTKEEGKNPLIANLATDCTINQYLAGLPDGVVTLERMNKEVGYEMEPFQTSDYYYGHFIKKVDEIKEKMGSKGQILTLDDHDLDIPDASGSFLEKAAIQAAAKAAVSKSAGNVPEHLTKIIESLNPSSINWKQVLRNFVMSRVANTTRFTQKRVNRRFALPAPGKVKKRTMTLGVCVDTSGSISEDQFSAFMSEVKSISKQVTHTYLVNADCEVWSVTRLGKKITNAVFERKGYGGTAYQPAITKCKELACDVIIYFGDFDTSDVPADPKVPFLWVGVGTQAPPATFGKVLRISG